jgi:Rrf2 family protein
MSKIVSLSEAASIALHAMILIGRSNGNSVNVDNIAKVTESSRHHVAKVMQRLAKENYVGSFRGPNGGFFLVQKPKEITLLAIYEAIEGKVIATECPMDKKVCSFDHCFFNNLTYDMTMQFRNYMLEHSLADYL